MRSHLQRARFSQTRGAWFAVIHSKGTPCLARMRKDGSGPAGAKAIRSCHVPVLFPEWIMENVGHNNSFSAVHGCTAGSRFRSDGKTVDGGAVGFGKAGCGAMSYVQPVILEEQDRTKHARKLGFDNQYEALQYRFEWSIVCDHLQNPALSVTECLRTLAFSY